MEEIISRIPTAILVGAGVGVITMVVLFIVNTANRLQEIAKGIEAVNRNLGDIQDVLEMLESHVEDLKGRRGV